jgi:hypothetical protein
MPEHDSQALPSFASLDELVEFFDKHDMGEYEAQLPNVHFDISDPLNTVRSAKERVEDGDPAT